MSYQVVRVPSQQVRTDKTIQDNAYFDSVNQSIQSLVPVGPYANDAAAATAKVPITGIYFDASGILHRRMT